MYTETISFHFYLTLNLLLNILSKSVSQKFHDLMMKILRIHTTQKYHHNMSSSSSSKPELKDWNQPAFGEKSTVQRRRVNATSLVKSDQPQEYSTSATRTAYRDTINAEAESISRSLNNNNNNSNNTAQRTQASRREGGTWKTSDGLQAALHQSNTTIKDYTPSQRDISKKFVVDKIQQPKRDEKAAVDSNVVLLQGTRVRGIGFR